MTVIQNLPPILDQVSNPNPIDTNLLHVKPLTHQLCRGISYLGTTLHQSAHPERWHGTFKIGLAKVVIFSGYILNTVLATIESIAALTLSLLVLSLHAITRARSLSIQKITLKVFAYFVNTVLVNVIQVVCLRKGVYSPYHSLNSISNHGVHATAAIIAQFLGFGFDHWAGRNPVQANQPAPSVIRSIRILIEIAPIAIREATTSAVRDFSVHIRNNQANPNLQIFLRNNPNHVEILNQFDFERFCDSDEYRGQFVNLIANYLVQTGILQNLQANLYLNNLNGAVQNMPGQVPQANQLQVYGVNNNEKDKEYQENLKGLIKKSVIDLYDNDELVRMLSKQDNETSVQDGRDELEAFSNEIFIPIANFTQLRELDKEIRCPETFAAQDLSEYNERHRLLKDAYERRMTLSPEEYLILSKYLLKTADFNIAGQGLSEERVEFIKKLFIDISALASQLHQGKLLTEKYVDIGQLNQGRIHDAFGANHLFGTACQDAIKEISERPAPAIPKAEPETSE